MIKFQVPRSSKPGIPYSQLGHCNKDILEENLELITILVLERLRRLGSPEFEKRTKDASPLDLVEAGYVDLVRVFVKNEPHSASKLKSNRWRLICCVSIVDQLVERLLCSAQNKAEIGTWKTIPSAPGLGLTRDHDLAEFRHRIKNLSPNGLAEADVVGWDWSVQPWEIDLDTECRIELGNMRGFPARVLRARAHCLKHAVLSIPDGRLFRLAHPGIQLSGSYNTSSTNSRMRVAVALLAGAKWAVAMGDDCLEDPVADAEQIYARYGHPLKMYVRRSCGDPFEFCSTLFTEAGAWPVDGTKTLYRLIEQKTISDELHSQFAMEIRNSPRRDEFFDCVTRVLTANGKGGRGKSLD